MIAVHALETVGTQEYELKPGSLPSGSPPPTARRPRWISPGTTPDAALLLRLGQAGTVTGMPVTARAAYPGRRN